MKQLMCLSMWLEWCLVAILYADEWYALQDDIRREAQTMSLIEHPNIIRACCSFVVDSYLWVVMPFMAEGSCFHLMKIAYQDGFEESIIRSILKETLIALEYLHKHGHIHRDVKVKFQICCTVLLWLCFHIFFSLDLCCFRLGTFFLIVLVGWNLVTLVFQHACSIKVIGNA